jgi:arylformamidase
MSDLIDISVPLMPDMPIWPDSVGFRVHRSSSIAAGDRANVSRLDMDVHAGTHVEGPLHFLADGDPIESFALDTFVGPAIVADLVDAEVIGPAELERAAVPEGALRLLLKTRNSALWRSRDRTFRTDYVALSAEGARWVTARGIRLVGIDYLSIQRYGDDPEAHRVLMRDGVVILEGLNLERATPGEYRLVCLPLSLTNTEASPARAILEPLR